MLNALIQYQIFNFHKIEYLTSDISVYACRTVRGRRPARLWECTRTLAVLSPNACAVQYEQVISVLPALFFSLAFCAQYVNFTLLSLVSDGAILNTNIFAACFCWVQHIPLKTTWVYRWQIDSLRLSFRGAGKKSIWWFSGSQSVTLFEHQTSRCAAWTVAEVSCCQQDTQWPLEKADAEDVLLNCWGWHFQFLFAWVCIYTELNKYTRVQHLPLELTPLEFQCECWKTRPKYLISSKIALLEAALRKSWFTLHVCHKTIQFLTRVAHLRCYSMLCLQ